MVLSFNYFSLKDNLTRSLLWISIVLLMPTQYARGVEEIWNMVSEFGLTASNGKSATTRAIDAARLFFDNPANNAKDLVLFFPSGTYDFSGPDQAILVDRFLPGMTGHLIFRGAGRTNTTFNIRNNQNASGASQWGFYVNKSPRIVLQDFHLTVEQQTVSQGTVTNVGNGFVDLQIHSGFATPKSLEIDRANEFGRYLRKYTNNLTNPQVVQTNNDQVPWDHSTLNSNGTWRMLLSITNAVPPYTPGDIIGIKGKHGKDVYRFLDSPDAKLQRLKLSRKTRGIFLRCDNTTIDDIWVAREIIAGRTACLSSPEGGPQFHATAGGTGTSVPPNYVNGLSVKNCNMAGTGDDCIGIFEQNNGTISLNTFRDSFARGIFNYHGGSGLVFSNNTLIRAPQLDDPLLP